MMRRTKVRQALHLPARPWLTRALLVLYVALSASLDLHHNHGAPSLAGNPVLSAGSHDHAPCPVDQFQSAHGPAAWAAPLDGPLPTNVLPLFNPDRPWLRTCPPTTRPRAPPAPC